MLKTLKNLAKREGGAGALTGKQFALGARQVKVDRLLGEGGFATIYRCTDLETGETLALKHFVLTGYPDAARDADMEVAVMERLSASPCVVRLHEASLAGPLGTPTAAYALMDFCPDTLVGYLQQRSYQVDDATLLRIALPVVRAVQAMHSLSPPLAHRDLKAENVLRGPSGRWVLCDFGSCSARHGVLESAHEIALEEEVVRRYTTPAYRAPELYDLYAREYVGTPVDIWALGVLLYLLAFGRLPFEGEAKLQVLNGRYSLPEARPAPLRALIRDMLQVSPRDRPTIHEVLARLAGMAPPQVWEEFPDMHDLNLQAAPEAAQPAAAAPRTAAAQPAGTAAGRAAPALHERVPSQGWADFAAEPSPAPSSNALHARDGSGSGSWATFSPKRSGEAEGSAPAVPAASVGSFWSSFGEELPSDAVGTPAHAPIQDAKPPPGQQQPRPKPSASLVAQQLAPSVAAAAAAACTPVPQVAPELSPLSAGITRMSRTSQGSEASVAKPHAAPPSSAKRSSAGVVAASTAASVPAVAQLQPPQAAAAGVHTPTGGLSKSSSVSEGEALRQHSMVLEGLLEARNEEVQRLRQLVQQQEAEIARLRGQLDTAQQALKQQQQQQQRHQRSNGSTIPAAATPPAAVPAATASTHTPASSRLGLLDVPGSVSASVNGGHSVGAGSGADSSPWVSFSAAGGGGDAPTPTLLQPAGGSKFSAGSRASSGIEAKAAAAAAAAKQLGGGAGSGGSTPASGPAAAGVPPLEHVLRSKLDLSLTGKPGLVRAPSMEQRAPMRGGSGGLAVSGPAQQALRSFPVALTPTASPLGDGSQSAPPSAQPSPLRGGAPAMGAAAHTYGGHSPAQPGSPVKPLLGAGGRGSPTKHRRHMTAPDRNFFEDLNPLPH